MREHRRPTHTSADNRREHISTKTWRKFCLGVTVTKWNLTLQKPRPQFFLKKLALQSPIYLWPVTRFPWLRRSVCWASILVVICLGIITLWLSQRQLRKSWEHFFEPKSCIHRSSF